MKLLYSLLLVALICQLSIGESVVKDVQNIPCAYCNQVVTTFQQLLNSATDYNTIIENAETKICDAISQFVPKDRCVAFVKVYGSYFLKAIESSGSTLTPNKICVDMLEFCPPAETQQDPDSPSFVPLLPTMSSTSNEITWTATETGYDNGALFYYKVLIPHEGIVFSSKDNLIVRVTLDYVEGSCVTARVFQPDTYTDMKACKDLYAHPTEITSVQTGTWYYFIVTASDLTGSQYNTQFTLTVTEYENSVIIGGDEPHPATGESHIHLSGIFLPFLFTLAVAICCCCCCRRSKRLEHIKKQQQKKQLEEQEQQEQQHHFVDLQVFPASYDQQQLPPPPYVYYPFPPNAVPYGYVPVSAPPATNENLNNNN